MSAIQELERWLERATSAPRLRGLVAAGAGLLVLAGLLFRLDAAPIARASEQRTLEVTREMVGTGDWLVPRLGGEPRLQKPPLYYWAASAAFAIRGESRQALRLPSALAALGLVVTVFCWGRRTGGFADGALAALCLMLMVEFWTLGRRGDAEMTLAFFTTQALFAFDRVYSERRRDGLPWFFAAVWLAFLAKATAAILVIGLPIVLRVGLDRGFRRACRRDVVGWAVVCVAACLAWYAAILLWVPSALAALREALLLPAGLAATSESAKHLRPIWYHLPNLLAAAAPAIALAPLAAWHAVAHRHDPDRRRADFPVLAFASLFVAFSLLPMKQKHYLMPLLPLLALAIAPAVRAAAALHRRAVERVVAGVGTALLVILPAAAALPGLHLAIAGEGALAAVLVGAGAALACAIGFAAGRRGCVRVFGLAVVTLTLCLFGVYLASFDPLRTSFREGAAPGSIDFDVERWSRIFERHPALRTIYVAHGWHPSVSAPPPATSTRVGPARARGPARVTRRRDPRAALGPRLERRRDHVADPQDRFFNSSENTISLPMRSLVHFFPDPRSWFR